MTDSRDISYILKALPHRYPFLLVDRVLDFRADSSISALKNVTINEPHFPGHFPSLPLMPGVLQVETFAQVCGLLLMLSAEAKNQNTQGYDFLLASVDECRFRRPVTPGDQLILHAVLERHSRRISCFSGHAAVGEHTVCEIKLKAAYQPSRP